MDSLERDIEFQNGAETLRITPWLDMPRLRSEVKKNFAKRIEDGEFSRHYPQFKEDLLSFCAGEYHHLPRSSAIINILGDILYTVFDEYKGDSRQSRSYDWICRYMLQSNSWGTDNTLEDEREAYMDDEDRPDLPF